MLTSHLWARWLTCFVRQRLKPKDSTYLFHRDAFSRQLKFHANDSKLWRYQTLKYVFPFVADKMGIKTTVQQIVAAKQNMSIPDPVSHGDFLKCEWFFSRCANECGPKGSDRAVTVDGMILDTLWERAPLPWHHRVKMEHSDSCFRCSPLRPFSYQTGSGSEKPGGQLPEYWKKKVFGLKGWRWEVIS